MKYFPSVLRRIRSSFGRCLLLALLCAGVGPVSWSQAQVRDTVRPVSTTCNCGRWTCPICQQHCSCPEASGSRQTGTSRRGKPPAVSSEAGAPEAGPEAIPEGESAASNAAIASLANDMGATAGRYGAVPNMIGDFFGTSAGTSTISKNFLYKARGVIQSETPPGDPNGSIGYYVGNSTYYYDFYSVGPGADKLSPSPQADTFKVSDPAPYSSVVLPPPPQGFVNAGGVAQNPTGTYNNNDFWDVVYSQTAEIVIPGAGGLVVGRTKLAENVSPLPRDRVFFNYSFFDNVPLRNPGINMSRYTPGFEKTFFNQMTSFELRAPFASTLDSQFAADTLPGSGHVEFGDVFMTFKALVCGGATWDVSGGLSLTLPTADNTIVGLSDGTELVKFEHKSVHVMPFVGGLWTPTDRFFAQGFLQVDVDANGDPVYLNQYGNGLLPAGRMQETNFLYADLGIGYWMYRAGEFDNRLITGIAPTLEFHHNASLQSADVIRSGAFQIGQEYENLQMSDVVVGATVEWNMHSTLTAGYVVPFGDNNDQQFDGELRLFWNRWF